MSTEIKKWVELYKINFFQPKTEFDKNQSKEPIIISKDAFNLIKDDLKSNKWIEINEELYNPFTIDTVKKFKMDENIYTILNQQPIQIQKKVKGYMRYEKQNTTIQRLKAMIEKAKEELNIN